jgi:hypothetical protein
MRRDAKESLITITMPWHIFCLLTFLIIRCGCWALSGFSAGIPPAACGQSELASAFNIYFEKIERSGRTRASEAASVKRG